MCFHTLRESYEGVFSARVRVLANIMRVLANLMRVSFLPVRKSRALANLMRVYFLQVRVIIADLMKHTLRVLADLW